MREQRRVLIPTLPPLPADPLYADVTWGAGGGTSDLTLELCVKMRNEYGMEPNMHLTCTNMPEEKIDAALKGAQANKIRNIVALRGGAWGLGNGRCCGRLHPLHHLLTTAMLLRTADPPKGQEEWTAAAGGFSCALDLVKYIRKVRAWRCA